MNNERQSTLLVVRGGAGVRVQRRREWKDRQRRLQRHRHRWQRRPTQRRPRRQLVDRRLQRQRRQLVDRRRQRHRRQPGRRLRGLHRGRPAGAAQSLLPDGQLEVDERPDRRRDDEVGGGQLGAQHLLHRLGLRRPRRGAQVLPRRAERRPGDLRRQPPRLGLRQLRALRLPQHLRRQQRVDDRGLAALSHRQRLPTRRSPPRNCAAHQAVRDEQLLRGATERGAAATGCSDFPGYCHLRDICTPSEYATPNVALGTLPGAASGLNAR